MVVAVDADTQQDLAEAPFQKSGPIGYYVITDATNLTENSPRAAKFAAEQPIAMGRTSIDWTDNTTALFSPTNSRYEVPDRTIVLTNPAGQPTVQFSTAFVVIGGSPNGPQVLESRSGNDITVTGHSFTNGDPLIFRGGTPPAPLAVATAYTAIVVDANTIQASEDGGSTPVTLTDDAVGSAYAVNGRGRILTIAKFDNPVQIASGDSRQVTLQWAADSSTSIT